MKQNSKSAFKKNHFAFLNGANENHKRRMQISGRIAVVFTCMTIAAGLTAYRTALEQPMVRSENEFRRYVEGKRKAYRLTAFILQMVKDNYVDPTRLRPRTMLKAALDELQEQIAEVMVLWSEKGERAQISVDMYRRDFDLSDVDSVATLYTALKEILSYVEKYLNSDGKNREIEYAAINGMLQTLDPHSLLMDPDVYKNLKLGTRGSFGGLGIVISIREGVLTVVSPIDDTPAFKAGLKAGDVIVKIDGASTMNMTLNEAVNRLRGDPATKVELWIEREGWVEPRKFNIARAVIRIKSVASRMLKNDIGFLRIKQFSRNTYEEVVEHLEKLKQKNARGLILGLYNNPGGLFEQAIKVADLFLDKGDIVTTVGYAGKKRETIKAGKARTLWKRPVLVLVNSGSASASEILAGALKERGQAVVFGETTFGKGSVQVLFDNDDGSALKLTTRQYLTPGDNSIQSVGIVPDVELVPVTITKEEIKLFTPKKLRRENDLEKHLSPSWEIGQRETPSARIKYFAGKGDSQLVADDDISGDSIDTEVLRIASEVLLKNPATSRDGLLRNVKARMPEIRERQQKRIAKELKKLGVDWSLKSTKAVPMLEAELEVEGLEWVVKAGETMKLTMKVTNLGLDSAYRVRAVSSSISPFFDDKEFVFGKIAPGQTRRWSVDVRLPIHLHTQKIPVSVSFFEEYGYAPPSLDQVVKVRGHPRPLLAGQYQLIDDLIGNRDGLVQKGERVRLRVTVRNLGKGPSLNTEIAIQNLSGPALSIHQGRARLGRLEVGEEKEADLIFEVKKGLAFRTLALKLSVQDTTLRTSFRERIVFPVSAGGRLVEKMEGWIRVEQEETELRGGPDKDSPLLGWAEKNSVFSLNGRIHGWYRVEWKPGKPAFLPLQSATVLPLKEQPQKDPVVRRVFHLTPPVIRLEKTPLITSEPKMKLRGVVFDDERLRDVFIEVVHLNEGIQRRKVFYRSNRFNEELNYITFAEDIDLEEGLNYIRVVGRENDHVETEKTVVVLKHGSERAYKSSM